MSIPKRQSNFATSMHAEPRRLTEDEYANALEDIYDNIDVEILCNTAWDSLYALRCHVAALEAELSALRRP